MRVFQVTILTYAYFQTAFDYFVFYALKVPQTVNLLFVFFFVCFIRFTHLSFFVSKF